MSLEIAFYKPLPMYIHLYSFLSLPRTPVHSWGYVSRGRIQNTRVCARLYKGRDRTSRTIRGKRLTDADAPCPIPRHKSLLSPPPRLGDLSRVCFVLTITETSRISAITSSKISLSPKKVLRPIAHLTSKFSRLYNL